MDMKENQKEFAISIIEEIKKGILAYPYSSIPRDKIERYLDGKIKKLRNFQTGGRK